MEKIYVFGRGNIYKENAEMLNKNYKVVGFLDNAVVDHVYDESLNADVYHPGKLSELNKYKIVIASSYFIDMYKDLKQLSIEDSDIIFCINDNNIMAENNQLYYHSEGNKKIAFETIEELKAIKFRDFDKKSKTLLNTLKLHSFSVDGSEFGTPIDRFYIEKFLKENKSYIHGTVMEVQDNRYTVKFGEQVKESIICHVKGWNGARKVNFESGEGIEQNMVDCLICTQTLQFIFDQKKALKNIYKMLKPGGCALISVPGIKPISIFHSRNWGEYWSYTAQTMIKLCSEVATEDHYEVQAYGNVKVATAFLYGLSIEEMDKADLEYVDPVYPLTVVAKLFK